jgi:crossover junction endodeoxyribonuclease RuvC
VRATRSIGGVARPYTILGIDPGTATMGWGVVRKEGGRLRYVQHGAITTPPSWDMPRRRGRLFDGVTELVEAYRPEAVAVEELFFNTNVSTAITVGQARVVALLAAHRDSHPVQVAEYTPLQVKQAITSYGRADKRQVQEMVRMLLNLREVPRPDDAADGLAIAITHAFSSRVTSLGPTGGERVT